jgi:hypothetical protein
MRILPLLARLGDKADPTSDFYWRRICLSACLPASENRPAGNLTCGKIMRG